MPPSSSDAASSAFHRLDPKVQRWIWEQRWTELRDLQEAAVEPVLDGTRDVILSAATASGKTEAAFFPICTRLVAAPEASVRALYVGPLKALINDQFRRIEALCERLDVPVHRWHGDVSADMKRRLLESPSGILLITPESLESIFVNHGPRVPALFRALGHVVVDELHAFIGSERGRQLQSLLHRVETAIDRRVPRIALSATLGDMNIAAAFLRPGGGDGVHVIVSRQGGAEIKLQVRGYLARAVEPATDDAEPEDAQHIADHLFRTLRGTDNLIFANRRAEVERYADLLARRSEAEQVPNQFFAHHGSLSRELREDVEARLKKEVPGPVNVVCTSTLEMGIDIASVKSVAQIGAPFSVASTRQRLGRSGRRSGEPAILRVYVTEEEVTDSTAPTDAIREKLVQATAILTLLIRGRCEPPDDGALHLSTLVQQVLSLVAQHGGASAIAAYRTLCERGPFSAVPRPVFIDLLRSLGKTRLLVQSADGTLLLGEVGERIVNHFSFFAAFQTPEEFRLVSAGQTLGTLPISEPLLEGSYLIFAGRRWRIMHVDQEHRVVDLMPAPGGRVPHFGSGGGLIHDEVRREMLALYCAFEVPAFLDARARDLLVEGRTNFTRLGLAERSILPDGKDTLLFPWAGDRVMGTLAVEMTARGLDASAEGVALRLAGSSVDRVREALRALVARGPADAKALASTVRNKVIEKYDAYLSEDLLSAGYGSRALDPAGAVLAASEALARSS